MVLAASTPLTQMNYQAIQQLAEANDELVYSLEDVSAATTEANQTRLSQLADISQIETTYAEDMTTLNEELLGVQTELIEKRAAGYAEWGSSVQELITKEEEIKAKIREVKNEHDLATKEIILNYAEQKMAADGVLTDDEMNWLAEKRVEWGLWSEASVAQLDYVLGEVDRFYDHVNGMTMDMFINIHQKIGTTGGGGGVGGTIGVVTPYEMEATGTQGQWKTVPDGFEDDDYIVGMSSGERYMVQTEGESRDFGAIPSASYNGSGAAHVEIYITETQSARDTAREVVRELKLQGVTI